MQGHVPVPPQPHFPVDLSPVIGYIATREPQPLEERTPPEQEWGEMDGGEEDWGPRHSKVIKATAVIVSLSLLVAGVGAVLDLVLAAH
jgi:hypothetical protein